MRWNVLHSLHAACHNNTMEKSKVISICLAIAKIIFGFCAEIS